MTGLITLAIIGAYLGMGVRYVMPFAHASVQRQKKDFPYSYREDPAQVHRAAVWVGIGQSLFWPYILIGRWVTDRLVNNLTADERKAKELEEARKVIADYEAEQFAKITEPSRKWSDFV